MVKEFVAHSIPTQQLEISVPWYFISPGLCLNVCIVRSDELFSRRVALNNHVAVAICHTN